VWAPVAARVEVEIETRDGSVVRTLALERDEDGFFAGEDAQGRAGDLYKFRIDEAARYPDPASRWQPLGVHGPSMVIDSRAYPWRGGAWKRPAVRDLVIYELHVGTFTRLGTFQSAIERLPYLQALGVNAIELMPLGDFAGERNWGYDGVYLYAPAHAYGHPDDLRALIDGAHSAGIAVILDVVYNHFGPDGNYLAAYIGDYLDEEEKTPWGGAIRYGSPEFQPLREFVIRNPEYWMDEFRIDGFRLDATHAIVDGSARHILAEITERIHRRGGYAIAEDNRNEVQLVKAVADGGLGFDAVWADDFHHVVRVANTRERDAYLGDFTGSLAELAATIADGWLYSGQHSPFAGRPRGTAAGELRPGNCVHCISNHDQIGNRAFGERLSHTIRTEAYLAASALLCLSPHLPMLFMGQEWAASTPFLFFTDHTEELGRLITAGRREEFKGFAAFQDPGVREQIPDPQAVATFEQSRLNWEEQQRPPHEHVLALYRACLALRREQPALRPVERSAYWAREVASGLCAIGFSSNEAEWLLLVDLVGGHEGTISGLPIDVSAGEWQVVLSTRERRFGGDGKSGVSERRDSVAFDRPETVLLTRRREA
jgi:maltooligosyltrehalose trehalohydrolase